jgi:Uma2 family endonuclease
MSIASRLLTYEDLERAREGSNERFELIEGELFVTPAPSLGHQDISGNLYALFRAMIFESGLGRVYYAPVDVRLAERTIVQPDLIIVLADRQVQLAGPRVEGAPSLAVEIISKSTSQYDRQTKRGVYAQYEVPEYWLVDPLAQSITIYSDPHNGRYHTETEAIDVAISATIPGLSADLAAVFANVIGE